MLAKTTMEDDITKYARGYHNHIANSAKNKAEKIVVARIEESQ